MPNKLSGGERQRVGMARALLTNPSLLLMDEPLSALDKSKKDDILPFIQNIPKDFNTPVLYISHSIEEIISLADYLVVLNKGSIDFIGPIKEIFNTKKFILRYLNEPISILEDRVESYDSQNSIAFFESGLKMLTDINLINQKIRIGIDSRQIYLSFDESLDSYFFNKLKGQVISFFKKGLFIYIEIKLFFGLNFIYSKIPEYLFKKQKIKNNSILWVFFNEAKLIKVLD